MKKHEGIAILLLFVDTFDQIQGHTEDFQNRFTDVCDLDGMVLVTEFKVSGLFVAEVVEEPLGVWCSQHDHYSEVGTLGDCHF
jgi:hypothetical protein